MTDFPLCRTCRAEYDDPGDRRFHAQAMACPDCGPRLDLVDAAGRSRAQPDEALEHAIRLLDEGGILAMKGLGGFLLLVNAADEHAVERLRRRKGRPHKPFALLAPDLAAVHAQCIVSEPEHALLTSPARPIVLLERRRDRAAPALSPAVAPGCPDLGVMLPASPLRHLLARGVGRLLVATSGNLTDEPIAIDDVDARSRLGLVADRFLVHDRRIAQRLDDSVARVVHGQAMLLRRARGFAPVPLLHGGTIAPVLALGGHSKSTVAFSAGGSIDMSPHIGDLATAEARAAFGDAVRCTTDGDSPKGGSQAATLAVCDLHPDYASTRYAERLGLPLLRVQHHHAHVLACMAEHRLDGPVLGIAWDGNGHGPEGPWPDAPIWGGEFLEITDTGFERVAHLRPFALPGGERAFREPLRCALGLLHAFGGAEAIDRARQAGMLATTERDDALLQMLEHQVLSPRTTSIGRLFDAVACLLGLGTHASFEGQAAIGLEALARAQASEAATTRRVYGLALSATGTAGTPASLDWAPLVEALLADRAAGIATGAIALGFHDALAAAALQVAVQSNTETIVLTGGCFQNRLLLERTVTALRAAGLHAWWPQRFPANDGGLALGQIAAAARAEQLAPSPAGAT